jgi:hypothetical protein
MHKNQTDLKNNYNILKIESNPKRSYPIAQNWYYECPLCHYWIPSFPSDYSEAKCECGHLSIGIDWDVFSVRDHGFEPKLLQITPKT